MTTWYFSAAGDDTTGDGSEALPYETLAKAEAVMGANDTLRFNGGDTFRQNQFPGALILSASGITVNSYGTGKAKFAPAILDPTWTGPDGNGEYTYTNASAGTYRVLLENGARMVGTTNDNRTTADSPAPGTLLAGEFGTTGTTIYYKPTTGAPTDHTVEVVVDTRACVTSDGFDNITIEDIEAYGASNSPCIFPKDGDSITVSNCYAHDAWRGIQTRACHNSSLINNYVDNVIMQAIGSESTSNPSNFLTVANNRVTRVCINKADDGDATAYNAQPGSTNNIFENNYADQIGTGGLSEPSVGMGIEFDDVPAPIARGNFLKRCRVKGIHQSARSGNTRAGATITGNLIIECGLNLETLVLAPAGIMIDAQATSTVTDPKIYNNTFYGNTFRHTNGINGSEIMLYAKATATLTGALVKNNVVSGSNSLYFALTRTAATTTAMSYTFDYNCYHEEGNTSGMRVNDDASLLGVTADDQTWAEGNIIGGGSGDWDNDHSQDANSIVSDPLFIDSANDEFRLAAGSPCSGTGETIDDVFDYYDMPFRQGSYDMGSIRASQGLIPAGLYKAHLSKVILRK